MTSILSTISGFFSKPLILSSFLPVTIFILLSWLLLVPIWPPYYPVFQPLESLDEQWKLLAVSFIAIVASGVIYNLNIQILRFYQGYPWQHSWIGRLRTNRFKKEYERREVRILGLRVLLRAMDSAKTPNNVALMERAVEKLRTDGLSFREIDSRDKKWLRMWLSDDDYRANMIKDRWERIHTLVLDEYTKMLERIRREFPQEEWLILPTRLGNTIRSFEHYPKREYGIDGQELWPRLVACVDKEYAALVDDAKTSCDFFVTCSMLSGILSAAFILVALLQPVAITGRAVLVATLVKAAVFAVLSYALYQLAIPRAGEWGKTVKSAFDLYRWKLLSQLGYKQQLDTRGAEREIWKEISRQAIFGDSFVKNAPLDYIDEKPRTAPFVAHGSASAVQLEIARGIQVTAESNRITVFLQVKNTDATSQVDNVVVTDRLPDGLHYEWDSAVTNGSPVAVSGSNPYRFAIAGSLGANQSVTLTYRAIALSSKQTHNVGLHLGTV